MQRTGFEIGVIISTPSLLEQMKKIALSWEEVGYNKLLRIAKIIVKLSIIALSFSGQ